MLGFHHTLFHANGVSYRHDNLWLVVLAHYEMRNWWEGSLWEPCLPIRYIDLALSS